MEMFVNILLAKSSQSCLHIFYTLPSDLLFISYPHASSYIFCFNQALILTYYIDV